MSKLTFKQFLIESQWPVSDVELEKFFSYYGPGLNAEEIGELTHEEWSDRFTDEQIDEGMLDEFMAYAYQFYRRLHGV